MSVCWMFLILLGCKLSRTTQSESTCSCNEKVKTFCRPLHVLCPNVTATKMMFHLIKDHQVISNVSCRIENNTLDCSSSHSREGVELCEDKQHKSVSFIFTRANSRLHGTYWCDSTVILPPPFKIIQNTLRVQVLVEGQVCDESSNTSENPSHGFVWVWILVVAFLGIYSITATIVAIAIWVKLRKTDSQSDYMNTKPRATRDRRKKKGVQNPIPRHF
ncbi:T-cell-specific surface glycoprotein CD28 [Trachinotus anak]|uniref:T-cell-specific surface glycoprotein CD28 n=1 Tax=Trachinotus anak TaxID=443729 RepID=UPI0039F21021